MLADAEHNIRFLRAYDSSRKPVFTAFVRKATQRPDIAARYRPIVELPAAQQGTSLDRQSSVVASQMTSVHILATDTVQHQYRR